MRDLETALTPPDLDAKEAAERKARKELQALKNIARGTRRQLDGSADRQMAEMRASYGL